jgi:hypothetical protein
MSLRKKEKDMAYQNKWIDIVNRFFVGMLVLVISIPWQNASAQTIAGVDRVPVQRPAIHLADDATNTPTPATASLNIVVPSGPYTIGQQIILSVNVDTPVNSRGAQFGLTFNPAVLQCVQGDEGTFYSDWANQYGSSTSVYPSPKCYNTGSRAGTVSDISIFLQGSVPGGPSGKGVIATYTFKILANGYSALDFINTTTGSNPDVPLLYDDSHPGGVMQNPIPRVLVGSQIQVGPTQTPSPTPSDTTTPTSGTPTDALTPTYTQTPSITPTPTISLTPTITTTRPTPSGVCLATDINGDGIVNIGDLAMIGSHWSESGAPGWINEDVNKDGAVNVGDLISVGSCWGESVDNSQPTATDTATTMVTGSVTAGNTPSVAPTTPIGTAPTSTNTNTQTPFLTITPSLAPTNTFTNTPNIVNTYTDTATSTVTQTMAATPTFTTESQMRIDPSNQIVSVGQEFEVDVLLNSVEISRGAQANLSWDPAILQMLSYEQGDIYSTWVDQWNEEHPEDQADVSFFPKPAIDNTHGSFMDNSPASIIITGANSFEGANSNQSGIYLKLHFKSKALGIAQIHLNNVLVYSFATFIPTAEPDSHTTLEPQQIPLSVTTIDGAVNVSASAPTSTPTLTLTATNTSTRTLTPTKTNTPTNPYTSTNTLTKTPTKTGTAGYLSNTATSVPVPTVASAARLGFDPAQSLVSAVGDTLTVNVSVYADKPMRGGSLDVKFNPSILECEGVSEGDFLSTWASNNSSSTMIFPEFKIDNAAGTIKDGSVILIGTATGGPTGTGTIIKITFKAKAVGVSQLTVSNGKLIDDGIGDINHMYAVAYDKGEVFVGVTPTATPIGAATATGTVGSYSSSKTATLSSIQANMTGTVTPTGGAGGTNQPAGIVAPADAAEIPVTGGNDANQLIGSLTDLIDANGILTKDVILHSADKLFAILLPKDAQALTADNHPLTQVIISRSDQSLEEGSSIKLIGNVFDLGPSGAVFNPPAKIIFAFDSKSLPKGILPEDLYIGYFNPDKKQWESLPSVVDKKTGTVTASIEHFSIYGLLAKPPIIRASVLAGSVGGFLFLLGAAVVVTLWLKKRSLAAVVEEAGTDLIPLLSSGPIGLLKEGDRTIQDTINISETESIPNPSAYPQEIMVERADPEIIDGKVVVVNKDKKADPLPDRDEDTGNTES